jgi:hypothetical protein
MREKVEPWIVCSGSGLRQVVLPRLREDDERCQRGQDPDQRKVHRPDHARFQMQRSLAQVVLKKKPQRGRISFQKIETKVKDTPKKKLFDIPVPSRDVTYQTLPGQE